MYYQKSSEVVVFPVLFRQTDFKNGLL